MKDISSFLSMKKENVTCVFMFSPLSVWYFCSHQRIEWSCHLRKRKIILSKRKGTLMRKKQIMNRGKIWVGFQPYSKTTTLFTQQTAQYSTFSWKDLVFFSKLHIKTPHTMDTFSLTGALKKRELATIQAFWNVHFSLQPHIPYLGIADLKPWRRG